MPCSGSAAAQCIDELVCEFLTGDIKDIEVWVQLFDFIHNREQKMRFPQTRRTEEKQRVIQLGRVLRDRKGSGLRELVG